MMPTALFTSLAISHGLTFLLLSDFPLEDLEDGELTDLCQTARPLLRQIAALMQKDL